MEVKYLLHTAHRNNGEFTKGIAIHNTPDDAELGFHNEFTAWGYGKKDTCDYVFAMITDTNGAIVRMPEVWDGTIVPNIG